MDEQIKKIADRLRGMREILGISVDEAAEACALSAAQYQDVESGGVDIPVSILHLLALKFRIDLTTLLTGEEPHMHFYTLTRKDKGIGVERQKAYKYEALAGNFLNRKGDSFIVTVDPKADQTVSFNTHPGQEFTYLLEGKLGFFIGAKEMILDPGDSIYFDSGFPHGMIALDNKPAKFLAIIL